MSTEMTEFDVEDTTARLAVPTLNAHDFFIRQRLAALPSKEYWEALANPATCALLEQLAAATCQEELDIINMQVIEALEVIVGRLERKIRRERDRSISGTIYVTPVKPST